MVCQYYGSAFSCIAIYTTLILNCFSEGKNGTPLVCAASKGHVNIINYLLEQNVDVNGVKVKLIICNNSIIH